MSDGGQSDGVQIDVVEGVADVRLNRPDKMNALDPAMMKAITNAGARLAADPAVRVVVLSGEGRAFCAGLDVASFQAMASESDGPSDEKPKADRPRADVPIASKGRITHLGQHLAHLWFEMPVPVIAVVHGVALGGGIQIALGADMRFVTPDVKMSVLEVKWGLVPDTCGTWFLSRLVGLDVAKDLTFSGRMVGGEEAVRIGLATRVCGDPKAEAMAYATELAAKSPDALRAAKRLLNMSGVASMADQFAAERAEIGALIGTKNQIEAVMSGFEKRAPSFADPDA